MDYQEQIKHPKWQKRRLQIMQLAEFKCQECGNKDDQLHIHHKFYEKDRYYWEYDDKDLLCLCSKCHEDHHTADLYIKVICSELTVKQKKQVLKTAMKMRECY